MPITTPKELCVSMLSELRHGAEREISGGPVFRTLCCGARHVRRALALPDAARFPMQ